MTSKFQELILYVARLTENDEQCGATKLNKILFYADFEAYRKLGTPISDEDYQKLPHGPAPRRLVPAVEELEEMGACAWATRRRYDFQLKKLLPLREADLSHFSGEEVEIVRRVVEDLRPLNAREVSDLSHQFAGWQAVEFGETIPYETVFVDPPRPLTKEEERWARGVVERYLERENGKAH